MPLPRVPARSDERQARSRCRGGDARPVQARSAARPPAVPNSDLETRNNRPDARPDDQSEDQIGTPVPNRLLYVMPVTDDGPAQQPLPLSFIIIIIIRLLDYAGQIYISLCINPGAPINR